MQHVLEDAIADAYKAGYLGRNILGSGFDCDVFMHRGAGAYEAGEETALIESLEGKRAQPRIKPPFPAAEGLYGCPTAVNNVETLCNIPPIITNGVGVVHRSRPREERRTEAVLRQRPRRQAGVFEATMHTTVRELIYDYAGGIPNGRQLKAVIPGGSSVPILLPNQIDVPASFDGLMKAGTLLGSAGMIVMDDTTCMVWAAKNLLHFYRHESCGKCTPCREGGDWLLKILDKIDRGDGTMADIDLLLSVSDNIVGKTLCAFGDAAATPVLTTIKQFRHEYEAHVREGRCTLPGATGARARVAVLPAWPTTNKVVVAEQGCRRPELHSGDRID